MDPQTTKALIEHLSAFITTQRLNRMRGALSQRTRHLSVVLEDIYQSQNASAVLRSCECFGIQDVHVIENRYQFDVNPDVVMGASKWLTVHKYRDGDDNTVTCLEALKKNGYRLIAASPHKQQYTPANLPLDRKTALVFGTEMEGLSQTAIQLVDGFMKIPMYGFTESFNISVSVAVSMYHLSDRLRNSSYKWELPEEEATALFFEWLCKSVRNPEQIIRHFEEMGM